MHLAFHELLDHLHIMAKYWNKVRKAKVAQYEVLQRSEDNGKFVTIHAQRNLFCDLKTKLDHNDT